MSDLRSDIRRICVSLNSSGPQTLWADSKELEIAEEEEAEQLLLLKQEQGSETPSEEETEAKLLELRSFQFQRPYLGRQAWIQKEGEMPRNPDAKTKCGVCAQEFKTRVDCDDHYALAHFKAGYFCPAGNCAFRTRFLNLMFQHSHREHDGQYFCRYCGMLDGNLKMHSTTCEKVPTTTCLHCQKDFKVYQHRYDANGCESTQPKRFPVDMPKQYRPPIYLASRFDRNLSRQRVVGIRRGGFSLQAHQWATPAESRMKTE